MARSTVKRSRRRLINWIVLLVSLVVLAVVVQDTLRRVLDAEFIEAKFNAALAGATNGLYRIEIGGLNFSLLENRLTATDVKIYPDSAAASDTTRPNTPPALYSISSPALTMTGTNVWALFKGKLESGSLHLVRPHLHLALEGRRATEDDSTPPSAADTAVRRNAESFHVRLARQLPQMSISYLRIDSGAFSWGRKIGDKVVNDSVGSISVELIDINTDSVSAADVNRVLFSDDVRFSVPGYARLTEDGVYIVTADSVSGSTKEAELAIHSFRMLPILSDSQLKKKWSRRTTRYRTSADEVRLQNIDLRGVFDESELSVGTMLLRKPELDVYLDKTLPPLDRRPASKLPHQSLQAVSWNVRLDTVRIEDGRLVYSERAANGARPGTIRFEEFGGEMYNISNSPPGKGNRNIATIEMRSRVNGAGRLAARMEYDMSGRGLNMSYKGSISAMDASVFNEVLVDLEGIKVNRGRVDTAWFNIQVQRDSAVGQLQLLYHDLQVSFLNKETGKVSFLDRIKTLVANAMKVKDSNPPSDSKPPTTSEIAVSRAPEVPLFGFLWVTIREGLLNTLGVK